MKDLEYNINRQLRLIMYTSGMVAALNLLISTILQLPFLPAFYLCSIVFFFIISRLCSLERFVLIYLLNLLQAICHAFLYVYILGDDCGIQMYLFTLVLPCNYIHLTKHSYKFRRLFIVLCCLIIAVAYMISDEVLDHIVPPLTTIGRDAEFSFTIINLCCGMSLLLFIGGIFFSSYQKACHTLFTKNQLLQMEAEQDALTGLSNRRGIMPALEGAYRDWIDKGVPFTIAIGDIDSFKQFNDRYGHEAGDSVLVHLGSLFRSQMKEGCHVSRWGGEEFLFLLPYPLPQAVSELERIKYTVSDTPAKYFDRLFKVTVTIGAAEAAEGKDLDSIIRAADRNLYDGKCHGKNCVFFSDRAS